MRMLGVHSMIGIAFGTPQCGVYRIFRAILSHPLAMRLSYPLQLLEHEIMIGMYRLVVRLWTGL